MIAKPEFEQVESPFYEQLVSMGWQHTTGSLDDPRASFRESFREVLLLDDLCDALVRINRNDAGEPWLDEGRVSQAVSALQRHGLLKLMEANENVFELLLKGKPVDGLPDWDGGRQQTVHYIDWDNPENNTFRVINQFRVDEPGGQAKKFALPDLVLFVNGIPLVVVECKSPYVSDPMEEALGQLFRYSNQRYWIEENEGNEKLFHTNLFMVASSFDETRMGTIGARPMHFKEWKDTAPVPMAEVAASLGKDSLSSQERLVAGMLRPAHLLDLARHFIVFDQEGGKTIKKIARYQQYRAVHGAHQRLLTGRTRSEDGEYDRRGGIVWHTQGSGKSLSMVFLVRKMRTTKALRKFKVVLVTDRRSLERQLSATAELSGDVVKVARKTDRLKSLLAEKGPALLFAMIQKYQEREPTPIHEPPALVAEGEGEFGTDEGIDETEDVGEFPTLNEDDSILVMVDEAHRSHASALHANLLRALPNCARIGFTGTPIIMGAKKRTHEIFGEFIDKYTLKESEEDGSTVQILYEGRTTGAAVADGGDLDTVFEDMFQERTPAELEKIKKKYATKGHVMEAPKLIAAKAKDMLRHYVENILPNGMKAQVVAGSRRATIRYHDALEAARTELVEQLDGVDEKLLGLDEEKVLQLPKGQQYLVRAHRWLDTLKELEFAPVISAGNNDDPAWKKWTDHPKVKDRIERFKRPLFHDDAVKRSPLAFLIVKSMLLTGFDAPVEQVMYLDRHIKEAELLQAIARTNRPYSKKKAGLIVDYYGVGRHLKEALAAYSQEDIEGALQSLKDEIPKLRDRHQRVLDLFRQRGIEDVAREEDACIDLLRDPKLRAEFQVKLKRFLSSLDLILPRPEALAFVRPAKVLGNIQHRARIRYDRDHRTPMGKEVGEKVRKLIDDHLISLGVDPSIPPISILDATFGDHVGMEKTDRAKASEMEHALRYHIRKHFDEDPEHYEKLSERLDGILADMKDRWENLVAALQDFVQEVQEGRQADETGLDPETQAPFLGVLKHEVAGDGEIGEKELRELCRTTVELVDHIQTEIRMVGFWQTPHAQNVLRKEVIQFLDDQNLMPFERLDGVADRIMELAKVNQAKLTR